MMIGSSSLSSSGARLSKSPGGSRRDNGDRSFNTSTSRTNSSFAGNELDRFSVISKEVYRSTGLPSTDARQPPETTEPKEVQKILDKVPHRRQLREQIGEELHFLPQHQQELVLRLRPDPSDLPPDMEELFLAKESVAEILSNYHERRVEKEDLHEEVGSWVTAFPSQTQELDDAARLRYQHIASDTAEDTIRSSTVDNLSTDLALGFSRLYDFGEHFHSVVGRAERMLPLKGSAEHFESIALGKRDASTTTAVIVPNTHDDHVMVVVPDGCKPLPEELFSLEDHLIAEAEPTAPKDDHGEEHGDGKGEAPSEQRDPQDALATPAEGDLHQHTKQHATTNYSATATNAINRLQHILKKKSDILVASLAQREMIVARTAHRVTALKNLVAKKEQEMDKAAEETKKILAEHHGISMPWGEGEGGGVGAFYRNNIEAILLDLRHSLEKERRSLELQAKLAEEKRREKEKRLSGVMFQQGPVVSPPTSPLDTPNVLDSPARTAERRKWKGKIESMQDTIDSLRLQLTTAEALGSEHSAESKNLSSQLSLLKSDNEVLRTKIHELQGKNEQLGEMVVTTGQKASVLQAQLSATEISPRDEHAMMQLKKQYRTEVALLKIEASEAKANVEKLRQENEDLDLRVQQAEAMSGEHARRRRTRTGSISTSRHGSLASKSQQDSAVTEQLALELLGLAGWVGQTMRQMRNCILSDVGSAMREKAFAVSVQLLSAAVRTLRNVEDDLVEKEGSLAEKHLKQLKAELLEAQKQTDFTDPADKAIGKLYDELSKSTAEWREKEGALNGRIQDFREEMNSRQQTVNILFSLHEQLLTSATAMSRVKSAAEIASMAFDRSREILSSRDPNVEEGWRVAKQTWMIFKHRLMSENESDGPLGPPLRLKLDNVSSNQEARFFHEAIAMVRRHSDAVNRTLLEPLQALLEEFREDIVWKTVVRKVEGKVKDYRLLTKEVCQFTVEKMYNDVKDRRRQEELVTQVIHCSDAFETISSYCGSKYESFLVENASNTVEAGSAEDEALHKAQERVQAVKDLRIKLAKRLDSKVEHWRTARQQRFARQWERFVLVQEQRENILRGIANLFYRLISEGVHGLSLTRFSLISSVDMENDGGGGGAGSAPAAASRVEELEATVRQMSDMKDVFEQESIDLRWSVDVLQQQLDEEQHRNSAAPSRQASSANLANVLPPPPEIGSATTVGAHPGSRSAPLVSFVGSPSNEEGAQQQGGPPSVTSEFSASRRSGLTTSSPCVGLWPTTPHMTVDASGHRPLSTSSPTLGKGTSKLLKQLNEEKGKLEGLGNRIIETVASAAGLEPGVVTLNDYAPDLLAHAVRSALTSASRAQQKSEKGTRAEGEETPTLSADLGGTESEIPTLNDLNATLRAMREEFAKPETSEIGCQTTPPQPSPSGAATPIQSSGSRTPGSSSLKTPSWSPSARSKQRSQSPQTAPLATNGTGTPRLAKSCRTPPSPEVQATHPTTPSKATKEKEKPPAMGADILAAQEKGRVEEPTASIAGFPKLEFERTDTAIFESFAKEEPTAEVTAPLATTKPTKKMGGADDMREDLAPDLTPPLIGFRRPSASGASPKLATNRRIEREDSLRSEGQLDHLLSEEDEDEEGKGVVADPVTGGRVVHVNVTSTVSDMGTQTPQGTSAKPFAFSDQSKRSKGAQTSNDLLTDLLVDMVQVLKVDPSVSSSEGLLPPEARIMPVPSCDPSPVKLAANRRAEKLAQAVSHYKERSQGPIEQRGRASPIVQQRLASALASRPGSAGRLPASTPSLLAGSTPDKKQQQSGVNTSVVAMPMQLSPYNSVASHFSPGEAVQLYQTKRHKKDGVREPTDFSSAVETDRTLRTLSAKHRRQQQHGTQK